MGQSSAEEYLYSKNFSTFEFFISEYKKKFVQHAPERIKCI